jgi:hypothetical protein
MLRYECEARWIADNLPALDRVMHCDSYDVFFQGDPFQPIVPFDKILLVKEDMQILMCDWNSKWLMECYGKVVWEHIKQNNVICTGIIAGSASEYLRLVTYMRRRPEWRVCWDNSKDQPVLNYLLWTGAFALHGFNFTFTGCFNGIFTMHWCQGYGSTSLNLNDRRSVVTPKGDVPFVLHQYNRYQQMIDYLLRQCGMNPFPKV